jgi:hypothetical protein
MYPNKTRPVTLVEETENKAMTHSINNVIIYPEAEAKAKAKRDANYSEMMRLAESIAQRSGIYEGQIREAAICLSASAYDVKAAKWWQNKMKERYGTKSKEYREAVAETKELEETFAQADSLLYLCGNDVALRDKLFDYIMQVQRYSANNIEVVAECLDIRPEQVLEAIERGACPAEDVDGEWRVQTAFLYVFVAYLELGKGQASLP